MARFSCIVLLTLLSSADNAWCETPLTVRTIAQSGSTGKFNLSNTQRPGMMVEIIRAIEHNDPTIHFTGLENQGPLPRVEIELERGAIDVFFGMGKTDSRNERFVFVSPPLYQTGYQLAARVDDPVVIAALNDVKALGPDGVVLVNSDEVHADYLHMDAGLTLDASAGNAILNLNKLKLKRGRFYFASTLSLAEEIRALNLAEEIKILPPKFLVSNVYAVFSKDAPNAAVERIVMNLVKMEKTGELSKIRNRYLSAH